MSPSKVSKRHIEDLKESRRIAEEAPRDKNASAGRINTGQSPSEFKAMIYEDAGFQMN